MNPDVLQLLGLALKAGKIVHGEEGVLKAVRSGQAKLVLLSTDASSSTVKKLSDKTSFYNVPLRQAATREQLGRAIGKAERVVVAVTDQGFVKRMLSLM